MEIFSTMFRGVPAFQGEERAETPGSANMGGGWDQAIMTRCTATLSKYQL